MAPVQALADSDPAARIPYAFARTHGVLPFRSEGDAVVVLLRPDATIEGIAELKRVLNRPLLTRAVEAETFATELARAYTALGETERQSLVAVVRALEVALQS